MPPPHAMTYKEILKLYEYFTFTHISSYMDRSELSGVTLLNRAIERIAKHIRYFDPSIVWTLEAGKGSYKLASLSHFSKRVRIPYRVYVDGKQLRLYGLREMLDGYGHIPSDQSVPSIAYWGSGQIGLHPIPDQVYPAQVAAECLPDRVTPANLDDECELPVDLHEAVAYLAATLAGQPTASDDVALQKLREYSEQAVIDMQRARDMNEELILGPFKTYDDYIG